MAAEDVNLLEGKVSIPTIITMVTIASTAATHGRAGMLNLNKRISMTLTVQIFLQYTFAYITSADISSIFSDTFADNDYDISGPQSHALCFYAVYVITHIYVSGSGHSFYQFLATRES